jgi:hypothetical protein
MLTRCPLQLSKIRDLLALITSFSLLSLYVTYHLGFSAGRLHGSDSSLGIIRQESLAYRDSHAGVAFRSPQLLDLLFKVSAGKWSLHPVVSLSSSPICCLINQPLHQPFNIWIKPLCNNSINTFQQQRNKQTTVEEFLESVFYVRSVPRLYNKNTSPINSNEFRIDTWSKKLAVRHLPDGKGVKQRSFLEFLELANKYIEALASAVVRRRLCKFPAFYVYWKSWERKLMCFHMVFIDHQYNRNCQ